MSEPFIAEIKMFAGNFAPRGYATCDGQLLPIAQYTAVFSLMGTTYGGDGRTTFGLPDLRGRCPIHVGQGPGLSSRQWGAKGGTETNTLTASQMPSHAHTGHIVANSNEGDSSDPTGKWPSATEEPNSPYKGEAGTASMADGTVVTNSVGGGQPVNNMPPFLVIYFIVALQGLFPSRN